MTRLEAAQVTDDSEDDVVATHFGERGPHVLFAGNQNRSLYNRLHSLRNQKWRIDVVIIERCLIATDNENKLLVSIAFSEFSVVLESYS
jgi:hypothetical protein